MISADRLAEWLEPQPAPEPCRASESVTDHLIGALRSARPLSPVHELLLARREQGRARYGTELTTFNGRDPTLDLLQELVDALVYAGQAFIQSKSVASGQRMRRIHDELVDLIREIEARP